MVWTNPATPVSLTAITTAFWNVNGRDNLNVLRGNTGSGDPTVAGQIAIASGAGVTAWGLLGPSSFANDSVTAAAIAAGAVGPSELAAGAAVTNIGYTPVSPGGGSMTGDLVFTGTAAVQLNNGVLYLNAARDHYFQWDGTKYIIGGNVDIATSGGRTFINTGNGGSGSGNDADTWRGATPASITVGNASACSGNAATASNASLLQGHPASDFALASATVIPAGLIAMVETAAGIPSGWVRHTNLDGNIPIGAGTSGGQTFVEATFYGTSWTPASAVGVSDTITVNNGTLSVNNGTLAASSSAVAASGSATQATGSATATLTTNVSTHTHPAPTISLSGSSALSGAVARAGSVTLTGTSTVWLPFMRGMVYVRKT